MAYCVTDFPPLECNRRACQEISIQVQNRQGQSKAAASTPLGHREQVAPNLPQNDLVAVRQTRVTDEPVIWNEFYPGKVKKAVSATDKIVAVLGTYGYHQWGDSVWFWWLR